MGVRYCFPKRHGCWKTFGRSMWLSSTSTYSPGRKGSVDIANRKIDERRFFSPRFGARVFFFSTQLPSLYFLGLAFGRVARFGFTFYGGRPFWTFGTLVRDPVDDKHNYGGFFGSRTTRIRGLRVSQSDDRGGTMRGVHKGRFAGNSGQDLARLGVG